MKYTSLILGAILIASPLVANAQTVANSNASKIALLEQELQILLKMIVIIEPQQATTTPQVIGTPIVMPTTASASKNPLLSQYESNFENDLSQIVPSTCDGGELYSCMDAANDLVIQAQGEVASGISATDAYNQYTAISPKLRIFEALSNPELSGAGTTDVVEGNAAHFVPVTDDLQQVESILVNTSNDVVAINTSGGTIISMDQSSLTMPANGITCSGKMISPNSMSEVQANACITYWLQKAPILPDGGTNMPQVWYDYYLSQQEANSTLQ